MTQDAKIPPVGAEAPVPGRMEAMVVRHLGEALVGEAAMPVLVPALVIMG